MEQAVPAHSPLLAPVLKARGAFDARGLKIALARLGFYAPDPLTGLTGDVDDGLGDALYAFQRRHEIGFSDTAPGPGSTTERILNRELADTDRNDLYVWRTVGDDKVRGEHAAREGRRFTWDDPPDGEHPGEDYNCRCWAEPLNPPRHPWIDWVRARQEERRLINSPYLQVSAGALLFEGAVISVEMCLRNGRCRAWLMKQAADFVLENTYHLPPKTLPAFPDAKEVKHSKGRARWIDSKGKIYEWDYQHGEVEVYDKTGKNHLGGFDPKTGKRRSAAKKNRSTEK